MYIQALIYIRIKSMQDQQRINKAKIDKTLATLEQMAYDNGTQSTQTDQLQTKTADQSRHIDTLNQTIVDQKAQLATICTALTDFDNCKQVYKTNIKLIMPLSTAIASLQTTMEDITTSNLKGLQHLCLNLRIKHWKKALNRCPETTQTMTWSWVPPSQTT